MKIWTYRLSQEKCSLQDPTRVVAVRVTALTAVVVVSESTSVYL